MYIYIQEMQFIFGKMTYMRHQQVKFPVKFCEFVEHFYSALDHVIKDSQLSDQVRQLNQSREQQHTR